MKLKPLLFTFSLIGFSCSAFANSVADSIGVENLNGKKIVLHKVEPKDNYYSIARRYNVRPNSIMQFNSNVALHIGDVIKVPTELPYTQGQYRQTAAAPVKQSPGYTTPQQPERQTEQANQKSPGGGDTQEYKVSAGETLYAIAKRFNTKVDDITAINHLKSSNLTAGQILIVPSNAPAAYTQQPAVTHPVPPASTPVAPRDSTAVAAGDSSVLSRRYAATRYGLFERNERGIATWMDDADLDAGKKLVLHRTAPVGTVIKITNPMTNRTTFAKVVGRFTDNENTKDVLLVMTKNVAESLGALDKRFRVNISYGIPE